MTRHALRAALAAAAILTFAATGCGDDDDTDASGSGSGSEAEADSAGDASTASAAGSDVEAYCTAVLAIETLPPPDVDFESASPEEISAALQAWATEEAQPLAADAMAAVPEEIAEDAAVLVGAVDELAESGDPAAFETPEFTAAQERVHEYDLANCGWNEHAVTLAEYSFNGIPSELPAGPISFEVSNDGQELHELGLVRVNDGVTETTDELLALPEEEVMEKITFMGEPLFVDPGSAGYKVVDLEPGRYIVACFIPVGTTSQDQPPAADAPPHAFQGMVHEFTVD